MLKNKFLISLVCIIVLGTLLRFYQLGNVPGGFHRDEAFLGYNAYSLLTTGREMAGDFLPLHLKSFLYSPAGYSYASIPFIALFGLTEFSTRFASALFGSLTLLVFYFVLKEVLETHKRKEVISLLATFFLAISPWHINLSRVATENILVVFAVLMGTWIFIRAAKTQKLWLLVLSFFVFSSTLFIYQAPRAFIPLFIPLLVFFYWNKFTKRMQVISGGVFILCIILPLFLILLSPQLSTRMRMLSILQHPYTQLTIDEGLREDGISHVSSPVARVFHNKVVGYITLFTTNYFKHFSYEFLFTDAGLPDRYRIPFSGLLYLTEILLLFVGAFKLIQDDKRVAVFILGWIFISPLGSALTYDDVPNLQRTVQMVPALMFLSAYGVFSLWNMKGTFLRLPLIGIVGVSLSYFFLQYLHNYYIHSLVHRTSHRQEGMKELVQSIQDLEKDYKRVEITSEEADPSIFFLFYTKYDPARIQAKLSQEDTMQYGSVSFEKYVISESYCPLAPSEEGKGVVEKEYDANTLYVQGKECKLPIKNGMVLKEVKRGDGSVAFRIMRYMNPSQ